MEMAEGPEDTNASSPIPSGDPHLPLHCGICLGRYLSPKMLPCLHTFCEQCLLRYTPPESLTLTCPVCRQQSILPKQGVSGLQTNFLINNLIEIMNQSSICHNCDSKSATVAKCTDCDQYLCDPCSQRHRQTSPTCMHTVLSLSEVTILDDDDFFKHPQVLMCPKHVSQSLRFYCRTCETAICVTCTDIEHHGHDTTRLRDAVKDQKNVLQDVLSKAYMHVPELKEALSAVSGVSFVLSENHAKTSQHISDCFDAIEKIIQHRKSFLLDRLNEIHQMKQNILEQQKNFLEVCLSNLLASCEFTENALTHGTETEIILVTKQMAEKLEEFAEMDIQKMPEENDHLVFKEDNVESIKSSIVEVGNIFTTSAVPQACVASGEGLKQCVVGKQTLVVVTAKDRHCQIVREAGPVVEAEMNSTQTNESFKPEVADQGNGSYDVLYTVPSEGTFRLSIRLLGREIKGSPFEVVAYVEEESSSSDRPVSSKIPRKTGFGKRTSKSGSSSQRSSGSRMRLNGIEDDLVLKVGVRGRGRGEFTNPQGVCCTNDGKIIVADSNNQCVQVFLNTGECVLRFGTRGRTPGQMQRPTGVAVLPNGNYAVADYENKWVSIFDPAGKYINRIGGGKLLGPKGIAVDKNGHIVVVDNKGNNVFVFQANGKLLYKFGGRSGGEILRFAGPHYAAVNSKNQVIVSDFHSHCIKVYDSEGTFLTYFGSNGEGNGQFNAPTGIAVDSQDNIIVADWGNCRIQVFDHYGSFLSFVNTFGDPLYGPQGLALTSDGYVVVSDSGNHCIKIYKYLQ